MDTDKFKSFFENMPIGCVIYDVVVDPTGCPINITINDMNKLYEKTFNVKKNEIIGKKITEIGCPPYDERINVYGKIVSRRNYNQEILQLDICNKTVRRNAFKITQSQCAVLVEDLTDKKNINNFSVKNVWHFKKYFELENIGISITSKEKKWIEVNDCLCFMLGYTKEELINMTWLEITYPDDLPHDIEIFNKIVSGEIVSYSFSKRFVKKNNDIIWVSVSLRSVRNNDNSLEYILALIWDISESKKNEEALRQSEKRYRDFFEYATEGIFQSTPEGKLININPAFARMFGYESQEEMLESITDLEKQIYINPQKRKEMTKILYEKDSITGYEVEAWRKDGSKIWVVINVHAVKDTNGEILCIEGTNIDITENKMMLNALKESELKFRSIFENALDAIGVLRKGDLLIVNSLFLKMFGYEKNEELLGKSVLNIFSPSCHEKIIEYINKRAKGEPAPSRYEAEGIKKNGEIFDIEVNVATYKVNDITLTMAIIIDITERKKHEKDLKYISNFLNNILESTPVSILVLDIEFNVIMSNKHAEIIFGIKKERDYHKNLFKLTPEFNKLLEFLKKAVINCETIDKKNILLKIDNNNLFFNIIIYPVIENNNMIGVVINLQDVSKYAILEENLVQNEKLKAIGELSASIAHEINQPLTGIMMANDNMMDYLLEGKIDKNYIEEKITSIACYVDRIKKIIEHVRAFSRIYDGTILMAININDVVDNALSLIKAQFKKYNIDIRVFLIESPPLIKGDIYKIEQVLLVLLSNSRDAIIEKHEKNIYREYGKKIIVIKTRFKKKFLCLEVIDNGIGISEENQKKLFLPFFTTKDVNKGTGLGLSIIYGILKEMKAEITVKSKTKKYTKFIICFNLDKE